MRPTTHSDTNPSNARVQGWSVIRRVVPYLWPQGQGWVEGKRGEQERGSTAGTGGGRPSEIMGAGEGGSVWKRFVMFTVYKFVR